MRLRNVPNALQKLGEHPEIVITRPQDYKGSWGALFSNSNPVHVEIGMGKGQFIVGMAKLHPEINFIGMERYESVMVRALKKILAEEPLPNLRLVKADAAFLEDYFAPCEVQQLYLNFSDPWPKTRQAKRRLTHTEFLNRYKLILEPQAEIWFKSDNRHLFEFSLVEMNSYGMAFQEVCLNLHQDEFEGNVRTEYEQNWSAKGYPIYRIVVKYPVA